MNISLKLPATILFTLATFCAAGLALRAAPLQAESETAQQHIDKARAAIEKNDFGAAEKELKRAQDIEKNSPEAYLLLAAVYHHQHKPTAALKAVDNAITRQPNYPDAHYLKAVLYYEAADRSRAFLEAKTAVEQGERSTDACALAGDLKLTSHPSPSAQETAQFPGLVYSPERRLLYENALALYESGVKAASPDDPGVKKLQMRIEAVKNLLNDFGKPSPKPGEVLPPGNARIKLLTTPKPEYTSDARERNEQGVVVVGVFFGSDGSVFGAIVEQGLKYGLNEAAVKAVYKIKFTPAMAEGKPTSIFKAVRVSFVLLKSH